MGKPIHLGKKVVVVGGGNVAMDVARTALRTGSDEVSILYRRTRAEMPASKVEIHHLEEEGVRIDFLVAPVALHGEGGKVRRIECIRMTLGECDASGRCRPVPVPDSNFMVEAEAVLPAVSQDVDPVAGTGANLAMTKWGTFNVDPQTLQTNVAHVFAGGDSVLGPQTAAKAVYQGKVAAESIRRYLEGIDLREGRFDPVPEKN
jgi:glutamate synthase (NADPH/NADH) small chain